MLVVSRNVNKDPPPLSSLIVLYYCRHYSCAYAVAKDSFEEIPCLKSAAAIAAAVDEANDDGLARDIRVMVDPRRKEAEGSINYQDCVAIIHRFWSRSKSLVNAVRQLMYTSMFLGQFAMSFRAVGMGRQVAQSLKVDRMLKKIRKVPPYEMMSLINTDKNVLSTVTAARQQKSKNAIPHVNIYMDAQTALAAYLVCRWDMCHEAFYPFDAATISTTGGIRHTAHPIHNMNFWNDRSWKMRPVSSVSS